MDGVATLVVLAVVGLVIFLVTREVWCWYWKINEGLEELRAIRGELIALRGQLMPKPGAYAGEFAPQDEPAVGSFDISKTRR